MPRIYQLILDDYEQMTLIEMRDHRPKAYLRERATVLLKVGDGEPIHRVAQAGLLRQREWETVAARVKGYERQSLGCLYVQKGRGRKPVFPPQYEPVIREDLAAVLEKSPREYDLNHSRWRLADFIGYLPGVGCRSAAWRVLHHLGFRYRRGWSHQVSPDPWSFARAD